MLDLLRVGLQCRAVAASQLCSLALAEMLCEVHETAMVIELRCFILTTHKKQAKKKALHLPLAEAVVPQVLCTTAESSLTHITSKHRNDRKEAELQTHMCQRKNACSMFSNAYRSI